MRRSSVRSRPRAGGGGSRRNRPRWTALIDSYTLAAGAFDESIIVAPADYRTATSLENECTFLRLRASLQVANTSATLSSTVIFSLVKIDENVLVDPANQANLQNGDVLWSWACGLQPLVAGASGSSINIEGIDVKAKRILSALPEGEKITLTASNVVGGGAVSIVFLGRALLLLKL